jgi:uncharacterized protein
MGTAVRDFFTTRMLIIITGLVIGSVAALLVFFGDPGNTGIAPTCFLRDISGALGLHAHIGFQYLRPEIIGVVLGAFGAAYAFGEFKPRGGSSPLVRFFLAMLLMVGALTFLGCPTRVILRLAGGDLGAIAGVLGLALGIFIGVVFLKRGFDLSRAVPQPAIAGWIMPVFMLILLAAVIFKPSVIAFSTEGFGAYHPIWYISLAGGMIVGALAQRSRICFMGCWRDLFLIKNTYLMTGVASAFVAALVVNLLLGQFSMGAAMDFTPFPFQTNIGNIDQAMSQPAQIWNFGGMILVGIVATMLGACPLRQIVLSGTGDIDAGVVVMGFIVGSALVRNLGASSCGGALAKFGPVAVMGSLVVVVAFGLLMKPKATQA